jgi:hypothetical protein
MNCDPKETKLEVECADKFTRMSVVGLTIGVILMIAYLAVIYWIIADQPIFWQN